MKAINIEWDVTDGTEDITPEQMQEILDTLPTEVEIPEELANKYTDEEEYLEEISDWLSDEFGFCHFGFKIEK